ncbi:MAG TPA: hypothetical protein PKC28_14990, partial [Bdellovibrionales bacterium]|nr:hypothetical protein [Bdellovibrionales bacterium]
MKFKCDVERAGENVLMRLSGRLDEKAELPVWPKPVKGHLTVDMRELQLINSFGCRAWVMWTRGVRVEGGISLVNCSPAVVNQINILSSFLESRIEVRSI